MTTAVASSPSSPLPSYSDQSRTPRLVCVGSVSVAPPPHVALVGSQRRGQRAPTPACGPCELITVRPRRRFLSSPRQQLTSVSLPSHSPYTMTLHCKYCYKTYQYSGWLSRHQAKCPYAQRAAAVAAIRRMQQRFERDRAVIFAALNNTDVAQDDGPSSGSANPKQTKATTTGELLSKILTPPTPSGRAHLLLADFVERTLSPAALKFGPGPK